MTVETRPDIGLITTDGPSPHVSTVGQIAALTNRSLRTMFRQGEFYLGIFAPVMLTICFYVPLRKIFDVLPGVDYGQFLMPVICLQSVGFVATGAAMRSATEATVGLSTRMRSMPIPSTVPMIARSAANFVLLIVSLVWALLSGVVIGWRPNAGVANLIGFFVVALIVGFLLALAADAVGVLAKNPQATSQALALPQLILGMLSTGFVPVTQFPEWIRPFARNQPISQFTEAMRSFDNGNASLHALFVPALWAIGVGVFAIVAVSVITRRNTRG